MTRIFYEILIKEIPDLYSVEIQEAEGASAKYFQGDNE